MPTATRIGEEETRGETTPRERKHIAKRIVAISMTGVIAAAALAGLTLGVINMVKSKKLLKAKELEDCCSEASEFDY